MRNLVSKKIVLFLLIISILSFTIYKYIFNKNDVVLELLFGSLNQYHYSPVELNDDFSKKVFSIYLRNIDYNKKYLLQSDVNALSVYKDSIDDQLKSKRHDFYKLITNTIAKRVKEKEKWYKEILSKPLDYSIEEEYETDWKKTVYSKSENELKREWKIMLKYQVLSRIDEAMVKQELELEKRKSALITKEGFGIKDEKIVELASDFVIKSFDSIEVDARRKTLKANDDYFKRLNKKTDRDRFAEFAIAITSVYDPHTEYFAPKEKKKFDQSMSGQFEGIGARLQQKDGILNVSEIIVGSPSYKQGELKAGDAIIKVAQGLNEPIDIVNMDIDEAIELIKGKKGTEVRLTVKKGDNSIKIIPIIRDVIEIEETYAKSALIENKNKIGYIYLPSFYTDFTRNGARHCTQDMRKEIEKLKKENIKGLIIDLRDNGGGSLQEVVEMAGLFFKNGPVVQVKGRSNTPINIMEDRNPDIVWDGPMTVLINRNSASASEILAAAMQDYKRAVIIGTSSFGKGTVQSFIDLDNLLLPNFDSLSPIGSIKITQQKFYRINGGTTQLIGVTPDILLPDPYAFIDNGEEELDNPMPWDEINKATYLPFDNIQYSNLKSKSKERISKSSQFALIKEQATEIKIKKEDTKYNLNIEKFRIEQKQLREKNKKYDDLRKEIKNFTASNLLVDIVRNGNDTSKAGRESRWAKNIAKDIYIYEASNVINDMK